MDVVTVSGRYSRQELFEPIGADGQRSLARSTAGIVGCGALGSVIADRLVRAGVGKIALIDRDFVELANLQRQALFTEEQAALRLPKAVAAASQLEEINSGVTVEPMVGDATPRTIEGMLKGCDVVIDATDNLETRFLMNDTCVKNAVPLVHGAAVGSCGQEMLIVPGETACYRCLVPEPPAEPLQGCDVLGVLNTITGLVANLEATDALKVMTGRLPPAGTLTYVDVWEGEFERFEVNRNPECPVCAKGEYEFLNGKSYSWTTSLCGRNAVQVAPAGAVAIDLEEYAESLSRLGRVEHNGYLLVFREGDLEMTLFPDGRAMIKGTADAQAARTFYSRFVGL